jgi:hypothetical protein
MAFNLGWAEWAVFLFANHLTMSGFFLSHLKIWQHMAMAAVYFDNCGWGWQQQSLLTAEESNGSSWQSLLMVGEEDGCNLQQQRQQRAMDDDGNGSCNNQPAN